MRKKLKFSFMPIFPVTFLPFCLLFTLAQLNPRKSFLLQPLRWFFFSLLFLRSVFLVCWIEKLVVSWEHKEGQSQLITLCLAKVIWSGSYPHGMVESTCLKNLVATYRQRSWRWWVDTRPPSRRVHFADCDLLSTWVEALHRDRAICLDRSYRCYPGVIKRKHSEIAWSKPRRKRCTESLKTSVFLCHQRQKWSQLLVGTLNILLFLVLSLLPLYCHWRENDENWIIIAKHEVSLLCLSVDNWYTIIDKVSFPTRNSARTFGTLS